MERIIVEYEIKYLFPFKSETRRIEIIFINTVNRKIIISLKGQADEIIIMKDLISMTGLKTLPIIHEKLAQKIFEKMVAEIVKDYNKLEIGQRTI